MLHKTENASKIETCHLTLKKIPSPLSNQLVTYRHINSAKQQTNCNFKIRRRNNWETWAKIFKKGGCWFTAF